jgi:hypothetical protein
MRELADSYHHGQESWWTFAAGSQLAAQPDQ